MSFESKIQKYAQVAVRSGVNIQPGQLLVINADVDCAWYAREVVKAAYEAGAGEVVVNWSDGLVNKMRLQNVSDDLLAQFPDWEFERTKSYQERGCATLRIGSANPKLLADIDSKKMRIAQMAQSKKMAPLREYNSKNKGQWSVELLPNPVWAKMLYPDCTEEEAMAKTWDDLFFMCRVGEDNDPVADWKKHSEEVVEYGKKLTAYQFKELRFKNSLGTDIVVGLVENHHWDGGMEFTPAGVGFVPNIPTEEIFCMPHRERVNGKVYASKPLSIQGKLVEGFWFEFKDGKVVDFGADKNLESLENLLNMDEGAKHLGEVALISFDSPISKTGKLFYNGLIDENAACHMALGNCYAYNLEGGTEMSDEELLAHGANLSMIHCDFMFGTEDLSVIGLDQNDQEVVVFDHGNFVI